jgi:hypothetical protein
VPHLQAPLVHRSAVSEEQTEHEPPPVPQEPVDMGSQTLPLQQPP